MTFRWRFVFACIAAEAVVVLLAWLMAIERAPTHSEPPCERLLCYQPKPGS